MAIPKEGPLHYAGGDGEERQTLVASGGQRTVPRSSSPGDLHLAVVGVEHQSLPRVYSEHKLHPWEFEMDICYVGLLSPAAPS